VKIARWVWSRGKDGDYIKVLPIAINSKARVKKVRCITSLVNKKSIAYHTNLGFRIVQGDKLIDDIPVHTNYDGKGNERVLFVKNL
jgi:hypothetical protein